MKYIAKTHAPACLQDWINTQLAMEEPVNVTYNELRCKSQLLHELTNEQFGLCGYTGAPVDEGRISELKNSLGSQVSFGNHIEHLKCQDACKNEVESSGEVYGRVLGDDLDYKNMIAALKIQGTNEGFGAVKKDDQHLPIWPTHPDCHDHFCYREDGGVDGRSTMGSEAIEILKLDHKTLFDWRGSAIEAWLNDEILLSRDDVLEVIGSIQKVVDGKLPEYAFVIEAIASRYL